MNASDRMSYRAALTVIVVVGLIVTAASIGIPRGNDTSTFLIIARTLLAGGVPYVDAWDIAGPGIYGFHLLSILAFGSSSIALRAFDGLWQLGTALIVGAIAFRVFRSERSRVAAGVAYLLLYYSQVDGRWTQAEAGVNLVLTAAMYALCRAIEQDRWHQWLLAGAGLGITVVFKLPLGIAGIAMLIAAVGRHPSTRRFIQRSSWLAVGTIVALGAFAGYFVLRGALDDYVIAQFRYAPQYAGLTWSHFTLGCGVRRLADSRLIAFYGLLGVALPAARWITAERMTGTAAWALWGWLVAGLSVMAMDGYMSITHMLPAFPAAAILAAGLAVPSVSSEWSLRKVASGAIATICVGVPLYLIAGHAAESVRQLTQSQPPRTSQSAAEYVRARTSPSDYIYVWGNYTSIYAAADRPVASRFVGIFHLSPEVQGLDYRSDLIADLRRTRPAYIIQARGQARRPSCIYPIDEDGWLESWPELKAIFSSYVLEQEIGTFRILRRPDFVPRQSQ